MDRYQNGKIYRIYSKSHPDQQYFGSTIQRLTKRFTKHKSEHRLYKIDGSRKWYSSFQILDYGDAVIELIEDFPCNNRDELNIREDYYIQNFNCINKCRAHITEDEKKEYQTEYYEQNIEKIKGYLKEYNKQNAEKIKKHKNEKFVCECGGKYTKAHKSKHFKTDKHQAYITTVKLFKELLNKEQPDLKLIYNIKINHLIKSIKK